MKQEPPLSAMLMPVIERELKAYANDDIWLARGGKSGKQPYSVKTGWTGWNDDTALATFDEVQTYYSRHHQAKRLTGVGICLREGHPLTCIDLDHCITPEGGYSDTARWLLSIAPKGTYIERSQSGRGIHILTYVATMAALLEPYGNKSMLPEIKVGDAVDGTEGSELVEVFSSNKFIALTGDLLDGAGAPKDGTDFMRELLEGLESRGQLKRQPQRKGGDYAQQAGGGDTAPRQEEKTAKVDGKPVNITEPTYNGYVVYPAAPTVYTPDTLPDYIDSHIGDNARNQFTDDNGLNCSDKWRLLYHDGGNIGASKSDDDYMLINLLCYWTHCDVPLIVSIVKQSAHRAGGFGHHPESYLEKSVEKCCRAYIARGGSFHQLFDNQDGGGLQFPFLNSNGKPYKAHSRNIHAVMKKMGINAAWNDLTHETEVYINGQLSDCTDSVLTLIKDEGLLYGLTPSVDHVARAVALMAREQAYHPVRDWLNHCYREYTQEGGGGHIKALWSRIKLTPDQLQESVFLEKMFTKFLLTSVAMAFNRGDTSTDFVPVLQGPQGCGKTTFFQSLVPFDYRNSWVKVGVTLDTSDKDSLREAFSSWFTELGEMGGTMSRSSANEVKNLITKSILELRYPYDRNPTKLVKTTTLVATINESEIFNDTTGNRRYCVFEVENIDSFLPSEFDYAAQMEHDEEVSDLWGEVMALYKALEKEGKAGYRLTQSEIKKLLKLNSKYEYVAQSEDLILRDVLDWSTDPNDWLWLTSSELAVILNNLGHRVSTRKVGKALGTLNSRKMYDGLSGRVSRGVKMWHVPPIKEKKIEIRDNDDFFLD